LELLKSESVEDRERAVGFLLNSKFIIEEDRESIFAAWRRGENKYGYLSLLAAQHATPTFVSEIIYKLKENPDPNTLVGHTYSNLRDNLDGPSNGVDGKMTENIECETREPCNSDFAVLQFNWISSNISEINSVGSRLARALENPSLSPAATLEALSFFQGADYFRPTHQMKDIALPVLRRKLASPFELVRLRAAKLLVEYGDTSGTTVLVDIASNEGSISQVEALNGLAAIASVKPELLPHFVSLLDDRDWDVRRHATIALGQTGSAKAVEHLISQVSSKDWLVAYSAASALRKFDDEVSKSALREIARDYWHPVVRAVASEPASVDPNLVQYPKGESEAVQFANAAVAFSQSPIFDRQDSEISNWCKSRFEQDGYRFVPDYITGPEVVAEMNDSSRHNSEHERMKLFQREEMKGANQPSLQLQFEGWSFTGTTVNPNSQVEYGANQVQLIVEREGFPTQIIVKKNIAGVFLWQGQPYVVTAGLAYRQHGFLMKLTLNSAGEWSAEPVLRLTGTTQYMSLDTEQPRVGNEVVWKTNSQIWTTQSQFIGFLASDGAMMVNPNGDPIWLGCASPSFP
jgi:hypothetical protein